jgi:tetraacyldisaccharide 4'-kinase
MVKKREKNAISIKYPLWGDLGGLLFPFSLIYGFVVIIRNFLFDIGILPQEKFPMPIICVGNLTVGGTGKTPHTELLINILKEKGYKVAVLSRGYKRKTKGFVIAGKNSTATEIGDEPSQIKSKFKDVVVAVDGDRIRGIKKLIELENPDVILLDDAFQHRYVKPGLSILLTDYNRLFTRDFMLPSGRLREPRYGKNRADIIIVTKCPYEINNNEFSALKKEISPKANQQIYFSTYKYKEIKPVFVEEILNPLYLEDVNSILLVSGIVSPKALKEYLSNFAENVESLEYPDHHFFTENDFYNILETFKRITTGNKIIIVTEKDAARLRNSDLPSELKKSLYSIGIEVAMLQNKEKEFKSNINNYVSKNKKNC